jgi:RNA polymerase primary sigma factor
VAKDRSKQLAEQLHARGLRKRVARALAEAAEAPADARSRSQKVAGDTLAQLRELTVQLEDRIGTPAAKRRQSAEKAAATRERTAAERSKAAQKAVATRQRAAAKRSTAARQSARTRGAASSRTRKSS